jgi:FixJ family two-component response regulator
VASTVFILDPDPASREAVARVAESLQLPFESYADPQAFLSAVNASRAGCLVLEFNLPWMSGLELQRRMAQFGHSLPLIFVTVHADLSAAVAAMKAGAVDFMSKPFRPHELYDAIRQAIERNQRDRAAAAERTALAAKFAKLTAGEQRVLDRIVAGQSKQTIARELGLSVRTIEVRRGKIMRKLQANSLVDLLRMTLQKSAPA